MIADKKIGFIGAGNMGSAVAKGLIASGAVAAGNILVTDLDVRKTSEFEKIGAEVRANAAAVAAEADIVILAVKPDAFAGVLRGIAHAARPLYISIAAGITIDYVKGFFEQDVRVVRVMPNTPALIGEGVTVVSSKAPATEADEKTACEIFECVGMVERMDERYLNAVGSVSGSSPAYVYIMIEAMADAAVADGIPRDAAYRLAAQAVAGSARMVLETGCHPGDLKDKVCSPGGTTIRAVAALERAGFRSALIDAMRVCTERSNEITR
ncbi:MAG: pyrroline-5-carboxylate reductase [Clostridiales bacterium]|jgi:pyrroline-5-carboxylate reductase|nr:pyrroline-5-carboxylate reductase [Clostridiales bacterium]